MSASGQDKPEQTNLFEKKMHVNYQKKHAAYGLDENNPSWLTVAHVQKWYACALPLSNKLTNTTGIIFV